MHRNVRFRYLCHMTRLLGPTAFELRQVAILFRFSNLFLDNLRNFPHTFLRAQSLFALVSVLLLVSQARADFWERFDQQYAEKMKHDMELYVQHKKDTEILGPFADTAHQHAANAKFAAYAALEEPKKATKPLFGLNVIGHGVNWWDESFTAQPLISWGQNLKNTYLFPSSNELFDVPDEVLIVDTPFIDRQGEVSYQENYNEFASMRSSKFGFGVGFMGVMPLSGSIENGKVRSVYRKETIRTAQVDANAVFYAISLLPPSFVKLRDDIQNIFGALPRFDAGTRHIWFSTLRQVGSHMVIGVDMGGSAHMDSVIDVVEFGSKGVNWQQTQLKVQYQSYTLLDENKRREKKLELDPQFDRNTQSNVYYKGGDTSIPVWDQPKWLQSLPTNLVPMRYRTMALSEFFPPGGRLHEDLRDAIDQFLVFSLGTPAQQMHIGGEAEVGHAPAGARIDVSSVRRESRRVCKNCGIGKCWCGSKTVWDVYDNRGDLIRDGGSGFVFGAGDGDQTAVVTFSRERYIRRLHAHVSPPGRERPTTAMRMLAGAKGQWDAWGPGSKPVSEVMEATVQWPVKSTNAVFKLGAAPPGTGSMAYRFRVYAVESSSPAGGVDSLNRFVINGWAFDPIEPQRALQISVYVDGALHAQGTTGVARSDISQRYELPAGSNVGFSVPLNIPKDQMRLHQVYVTWQGVTQQGRSETVRLWSIQPPGRLLWAEPSKVAGWAYIHDQPAANYAVDIFVNGQKAATGNTGNVDSPTVRSVFGVNANYGFEIPLQIKTAGVHTVTAVLTAPDGSRLQFEDTLTVDLRFPLGEIFGVAPGWVAGFAYDPSKPNEATSIQIFVDGVQVARGRTVQLLPDYNARYLIEGTHGFNVSLRMQGGKLHMVSVYAVVGFSLKLIGEQSIAVGLNDRGTSKVTNGVINFAGTGFNPCYGEWRLRVIDLNYKSKKVLRDPAFKETNLYNLEIPDEYDLMRNSEQIYTNTTEVFRDIKEWSKYKMNSWKAGFSLGFFGFSASYMKAQLEKHFKDEMSRVAEAQRLITLFDMKASPPELMQFTSYAGYELRSLPAYNVVTRPRWFRFFDLFGLVYAKRFSLGGRMDFEATYRTQNTSYARWIYERSQVGFTFTFYISLSGSFEKAWSEAAVDKSFMQSLNQFVRFIGGRPEMFNAEDSENWMKTIRQNPTIVSMEVESISELLWKAEDEQRKKWFDQAAADYMRTCTPEAWVCRRYNVANPLDGARVVAASSRQTGEPDSSIQNLLLDNSARTSWNGDVNFQFSDGDANQYVILDLGQELRIKAFAIDLDPYPSETGVWDFVRVETSTDQSRWSVWGSVGDQNGKVDITKPHYDFPLLVEEKVRYARLSFGGVRDNKRGVKINRLYAYSCA